MSVLQQPFGTIEEQPVRLFQLDAGELTAKITNYGGTIVSLLVPDKQGRRRDIVLGHPVLAGYRQGTAYMGAIIGRHANRIEAASFQLSDKTYTLAANDGKNHLHGGLRGFDKVIWDASVIEKSTAACLQLDYVSPDGEENYPGNLVVRVLYTLRPEELRIDYTATSDADTVCNLTNHAYFNLAGCDYRCIKDHQLMINSETYLTTNEECLPTGELASVNGTPMDFRQLTPIGPGLDSGFSQLNLVGGYDHNYVLDHTGRTAVKVAELFEPKSGRVMEVMTTKPGLQFYSGNHLTTMDCSKSHNSCRAHAGLCLETQFFPNAMKHKHFPSPVLQANHLYQHSTIYRFSTR